MIDSSFNTKEIALPISTSPCQNSYTNQYLQCKSFNSQNNWATQTTASLGLV